MEDLQNLAGKIEELKEKLTDGEYKDLLELAHAYYDRDQQEKAKKKFIKCLTGSFKLIINVEDECDQSFFYTQGDKFNFKRDCDDEGDLQINIHKNVIFQEVIYEVRESDLPPPSRGHFCLVLEDSWMNERHYEALKRDKYQADEDSIIVYLHDIE